MHHNRKYSHISFREFFFPRFHVLRHHQTVILTSQTCISSLVYNSETEANNKYNISIQPFYIAHCSCGIVIFVDKFKLKYLEENLNNIAKGKISLWKLAEQVGRVFSVVCVFVSSNEERRKTHFSYIII